jgi:ethanolamine utilization protein EutP (predicted NTPase)/endonuclease YncB( thermonuclease family)
MKKIISNLLVVALLIGSLLGCLSACNTAGNTDETTNTDGQTTESTTNQDTTSDEDITTEGETTEGESEETTAADVHVDYAAEVKLDMNSDTFKHMVTVKAFIDGDTTHFNVPTSVIETGVIKARYLAINTPESTGKIEEWGKTAAAFTKEKLSKATSIIIESDTETLNADSTGDRYMLWIWYKTAESDEYRNLNIEILQNGLAIASNSANNRYGETCMAAIAQARVEKLCVYSGVKDPNFYYGESVELTLKELRCNIESYNGMKVAFNAIVTQDHDNAVYVESYDEETDVWYGMYIYYGFNMNGDALEILSVGNEVRIVGTVSYYETGNTYQVSGLSYRMMKPDDPSNIQKLSEGHEPVYLPTSPERYANGKVDVTLTDSEDNVTTNTYDYAALAVYSYEADVVALVLSADDDYSLFPPCCTSMLNRDVIGIVTKTDKQTPERAENWLRLAGCKRIFHVDSHTGDGVADLKAYLQKQS